MSMKKAMTYFFTLGILLMIEFLIYHGTGMPKALSGSGLAMVAAYKFLWLMVLTAAAALLAPVGAFAEGMAEKEKSGYFWWIALISIVMIAFTAFSFLRAPKAEFPAPAETVLPPSAPAPASIPATPVFVAPQAAQAPSVQEDQKAAALTDTVVLAGTKSELLDPDTLKVTMEFENKSSKTIMELDYTFGFVVGSQLLFRINMREGVYIPAGTKGTTDLTWKKPNFKTPEEFDRLSKAHSENTLKIIATPTRALFEDGSSAGQ